MSLKCSLLGHRFDETSEEYDRQEDGSEVVTTITELETCSRCGETRVVSESKEVTTMETPDAGVDPTGNAGVDPTGNAGGADADKTDEHDPDGDDAEILDADGAETNAQAEARGAPIPDAEADTSSDTAGGTARAGGDGASETQPDDDAVIIDGDDGTGATGEAGGTGTSGGGVETDPEAETVAGGGETPGDERDPGEWPDEDGRESEEKPAAATVGESDGSGEWPTEPESEDSEEPLDDWPEETRRETSEDSDVALEESASPTITVPEGMFKCSECGFTTEVESSSLRAGDFCPECHRGNLAQHGDDEADD